MPTWVVTVLLEDDLLALNRAVGIIRRRNLALSGLTLGPTGRAGLCRLAVTVTGDAAATERLANQFRKMVGVAGVTVHAEADCAARDHLLVRMRVAPATFPALLDTLALFEARVVEERATDLLVEATGSAPFMVSFLRALETFGVLDVARGSALTLPPRAAAEASGAAPPATSDAPRMATAIPA